MATKAFMNNEAQKRMTDSMRRAGMQYSEMGYANGYVAVSPDHPLHGIDYDRVYDMTDISVWGGLTFSETAEHCRAWNSDCIEMIDDGKFEDIPADWWVFGFDTMHFGDGPHHDREWVISETRNLQMQLESIKSL